MFHLFFETFILPRTTRSPTFFLDVRLRVGRFMLVFPHPVNRHCLVVSECCTTWSICYAMRMHYAGYQRCVIQHQWFVSFVSMLCTSPAIKFGVLNLNLSTRIWVPGMNKICTVRKNHWWRMVWSLIVVMRIQHNDCVHGDACNSPTACKTKRKRYIG